MKTLLSLLFLTASLIGQLYPTPTSPPIYYQNFLITGEGSCAALQGVPYSGPVQQLRTTKSNTLPPTAVNVGDYVCLETLCNDEFSDYACLYIVSFYPTPFAGTCWQGLQASAVPGIAPSFSEFFWTSPVYPNFITIAPTHGVYLFANPRYWLGIQTVSAMSGWNMRVQSVRIDSTDGYLYFSRLLNITVL